MGHGANTRLQEQPCSTATQGKAHLENIHAATLAGPRSNNRAPAEDVGNHAQEVARCRKNIK